MGCSNFKFHKGDICDTEEVLAVFKKYDIDSVIHCAALSSVDQSFDDAFNFTRNNVMGTHVLLECSRVYNVKLFLHVSTDEVYGEVVNGPDSLETSPLAPSNPYSASKAAAELLAYSYYKSFNLPLIIVRPNNIYGPRQFPEKLISKSIMRLLNGQKLLLHGDGSHKRRYLYVSDAVDALDLIFDTGTVGGVYNIGSTDELTNMEVCMKILNGLGKEETTEHIEHTSDRPFNDARYAVDCSKLMNLGWTQNVSFQAGLEQTIEWYKQFGNTWWPQRE